VAEKTKDVPTWIKAITTILGVIVAIWVGGWSASQIYATNSGVVISHEKRVVRIEAELKLIDKRLDGMEKVFIRYEEGQKAMLKAQSSIEDQMTRQNELMIKRIEADARFEALLEIYTKGKK
jgi:hypothetical protein